MSQHSLSIRREIGRTLHLAYPVIIGQLGHIMMGVVDSLMVGRLGPTPLAAASLANGLFFLILVLGLGISYAITPLVAMAEGAARPRECGVVLRQGLVVGLGAGGVLAVLTFGISWLIPHLQQPPAVTAEAVDYIRILGYSVLPIMLFQVYRQFSEGVSHTVPPMAITLAANLSNIFCNWILIYGHLGMPALGLRGAGWATFITRSLMALAMVWYVRSARRYAVFDPTLHYRRLDPVIIRRLLRIGLGSGFQHFFEVGAFSGAAIMIGWLGTEPLAAHQIALSMAATTFMFAVGISAAAAIRVGNAVGRQSVAATRSAGFSAILLSAGVMTFFGLIFVAFRRVLPTLFIDNTRVVEIAAALLVVAALFQMSDGTQAAGLGVLRGMADVRIPTLITFIAYWLLGLPVGYALGFWVKWGVVGVWVGLALALTASAVMLTLRFHRLSRSPVHVR
ncbi:MAG: MATE family efflux transporter [Acidobacteria bacterium]|nr:MATE family efflux transporter [Acidobacteriota bacterium]